MTIKLILILCFMKISLYDMFTDLRPHGISLHEVYVFWESTLYDHVMVFCLNIYWTVFHIMNMNKMSLYCSPILYRNNRQNHGVYNHSSCSYISPQWPKLSMYFLHHWKNKHFLHLLHDTFAGLPLLMQNMTISCSKDSLKDMPPTRAWIPQCIPYIIVYTPDLFCKS